MKKKIKLAAFIVLVNIWNILVFISAVFMGNLTRELTYEIYYNVSPFISTLISISTSIVFTISTYFLGVLMFTLVLVLQEIRRNKK